MAGRAPGRLVEGVVVEFMMRDDWLEVTGKLLDSQAMVRIAPIKVDLMDLDEGCKREDEVTEWDHLSLWLEGLRADMATSIGGDIYEAASTSLGLGAEFVLHAVLMHCKTRGIQCRKAELNVR
ncbi:hypothetical protein AnigIFM63309_007020 [Aspergillus niger]|nr:hypothetical protein CBS133816_1122 [Aspergillus niger]KAI2852731.1 hypothetical protein CBS11350_364 [Aspergillus niger]KAI3070933.1 hypothetical protein CBS147353_6643 [Aspergillus niger]GLA34471.1 hypothetical protein AnigIFM63309_007020 [Aspergillus niger]